MPKHALENQREIRQIAKESNRKQAKALRIGSDRILKVDYRPRVCITFAPFTC